MIIDFKEIPQANKGGGQQDRFEQFACDLLETMGFDILDRPDRGADGKKDLIISETRKGVEGKTTVRWLVSCKHYAHSGSSVKDTDEPDVNDRVNKHQCNGFLGFYSTLPASSLSNKLTGCKNNFEHTVYDAARIEKAVLSSGQRDRLLQSYFPESFNKFHSDISQRAFDDRQGNEPTGNNLTKEDVLEITKTAIIILEIEKIKEEYFNKDFQNAQTPLSKLYRYTDHSNEKVADTVFSFLQAVAEQTRSRMPVAIAGCIFDLVLTFFSACGKDKKSKIENAKQCLYIGYSLVYDAFIYLDDFEIAGYGLLIFKFIYREANRNNIPELVAEVLSQYTELERTLNRPERTDLENAKEFVGIFKEDLKTKDLSFPLLPEHLMKLISNRV